ncbi:MAG: PIN domain-containing protein [Streptosporangiaceae bacterium]|jgi:rRNA-processing protein FCF1
MRLRNPGGADAALATVRQVKDQLWNADVQGNNAADRKNAFLTWCDQWATPQLGNHFPAGEDLFGELADSYYRVVQTPQLSERELNMLMARECKEWDTRLERLIGEIQGRLTFLAWPGRLVVLDTSALMEGVFFTDFDWHLHDPSLRGDAVRLVVPSLVAEELDDLKRHRDGRQKAQARRVLTALWDLHRAAPAEPAALPGRADVTIEVLLDDGWHRRMPNNDGEIIDQALSLRDAAGQPVILAAGDYTQLYRAAPAWLTAVLMPRADEA